MVPAAISSNYVNDHQSVLLLTDQPAKQKPTFMLKKRVPVTASTFGTTGISIQPPVHGEFFSVHTSLAA